MDEFTHDQLDPFFSSIVRSIPPKEQGNRGYIPTSKVKDGVANYESQRERDSYLKYKLLQV